MRHETELGCRRQMKRAGFTFSLASNGLEAIQAIEKSDLMVLNGTESAKYDVVLVSYTVLPVLRLLTELPQMDLEMPVMLVDTSL